MAQKNAQNISDRCPYFRDYQVRETLRPAAHSARKLPPAEPGLRSPPRQETHGRGSCPFSDARSMEDIQTKLQTMPVLRLFPPCALSSRAQGSSGDVANMPFAWRGHTKSLTTRARPSPDLAVWLE